MIINLYLNKNEKNIFMKSAIEFLNTHENLNLFQDFSYPLYSSFFDKIQNIKIQNLESFPNLIIYGGDGIGKYTFAKQILKILSPYELKYQKTVTIQMNKNIEKKIRISDIHYEIDLQNMIYNTKTIWEEMYYVILDIISSSEFKSGIILIKNFHYITNELLEIFQSFLDCPKSIRFILLSEQVSFIPQHILNFFQIIPFCNKNEEIKTVNEEKDRMVSKKNLLYKICDNKIEKYYMRIVKNIEKIMNENISYIQVRNYLYEILIYQMDFNQIFSHLFSMVFSKNHKIENIHNFLIQVYPFFYQYNNNYRPIYHLEKIIYHFIEFHESS